MLKEEGECSVTGRYVDPGVRKKGICSFVQKGWRRGMRS